MLLRYGKGTKEMFLGRTFHLSGIPSFGFLVFGHYPRNKMSQENKLEYGKVKFIKGLDGTSGTESYICTCRTADANFLAVMVLNFRKTKEIILFMRPKLKLFIYHEP